MKSIFAFLLVLVLGVAPVHADADGPQALQQAFVQAILAGDASAIAAKYAPDAISYPIGGMVAKGGDAVRESWAPFLDANTVQELVISEDHHEVHGNTAVAWGLWRMIFAPKTGGDAITMEGRFMDLSRNIDGKWLYVVDHASVPLPPPPE